LWMVLNPFVRAALSPLFNLMRPVPAIALIPVMVLWFGIGGIGEASKVFVIFMASFLYIVLNTSSGVMTIPEGLIRVANTVTLRLFAQPLRDRDRRDRCRAARRIS
jgi:taurine transport system permease protein